MCLSQSVFFFHEASRSLDFFKGKEVSVKASICLFVFINFDVFSSLDIEFNNTTFKFPRNGVNPKLSEFHTTYRLDFQPFEGVRFSDPPKERGRTKRLEIEPTQLTATSFYASINSKHQHPPPPGQCPGI